MRSVAIEGKIREELGTKGAKVLRREGFVPCALYGSEEETIHFYVEEAAFRNILYASEALLIEISINDKKYSSVAREFQFHPVTDALIHCDFFGVAEGKSFTIDVPVKTEGNARGVRNGGKMKVNLRKLPVKATLENMPGIITLNVENLRIGQGMCVEDVQTEGYEIVSDPGLTIVYIQTARNAADEEEEEETEEGAEGEEATAEAEA